MAELMPLDDAEVADLLPTFQDGWTLADYGVWVARAVERAHGIHQLDEKNKKPAGIIRHQWAPPTGVVRWTHCEVCGVIQRRDGHQSACKGPAKVKLRDGR